MTESLPARVGRHVAELRWEGLSQAVRGRAPLAVLDVLGCGYVGDRLGVHGAFVDGIVRGGGLSEATLWARGDRAPATHAALANGTVAHHVEMDDGVPRASLHGGVTIITAALAQAEAIGASGKATLEAIVAGYSAAVACGRPLVAGIGAHRLHPPSIVGCFGAAAAAGRLLGLDAEEVAGALALAGQLLPIGPFEPFTRGATAKDLYGGWPGLVGVQAAELARTGLAGPPDLLEAQRDGLGTFVLHAPADTAGIEPDPDELLNAYFKPYSTCLSVQPTLTALEQLAGRVRDPESIASVTVETYPFAVGLSVDSDPTTPIGARTSLPYCVASLLLDGEVYPEAFTQAALADPRRQALAAKVNAAVAPDMAEPGVRGGRVMIRLRDGSVHRAEARAPRWSAAEPATSDEVRDKFRRLAGPAAAALEAAVDGLANAPDLSQLVAALGQPS